MKVTVLVILKFFQQPQARQENPIYINVWNLPLIKMQEKTLLNLAIITAIVGLLLLTLCVDNVSFTAPQDPATLTSGTPTKIQGLVKSLSKKENVIFLTIEGQ